ncbi:hypothetical protein ABZ434_35510 [Streptomyces sp. NPDC005761]|uniref:hypothetical protein n=1 Tax=unclassified Streptomyces TaxID=2593676 RepID=UPI0033EE8E2D
MNADVTGLHARHPQPSRRDRVPFVGLLAGFALTGRDPAVPSLSGDPTSRDAVTKIVERSPR